MNNDTHFEDHGKRGREKRRKGERMKKDRRPEDRKTKRNKEKREEEKRERKREKKRKREREKVREKIIKWKCFEADTILNLFVYSTTNTLTLSFSLPLSPFALYLFLL